MDTATPATDHAASPKAVLFDVYGTLLDVYSVGLRAEQMFPGAGERLARAWRDKQIDYSRLVSMSGRYRPFWQLTRDALQVTAAALRLPLDEAGVDSLMNEYRHLSAFPENRGVLQALAERGIRAGVLSNGDPDMLDVTLRSAGLTELLDPILSVHATRRYKTDPAAYAIGPAALGDGDEGLHLLELVHGRRVSFTKKSSINRKLWWESSLRDGIDSPDGCQRHTR